MQRIDELEPACLPMEHPAFAADPWPAPKVARAASATGIGAISAGGHGLWCLKLVVPANSVGASPQA